tara:strand:- start:233 stop:430 length:198 start_codon:yes stop_codon:yes gene_type:complete
MSTLSDRALFHKGYQMCIQWVIMAMDQNKRAKRGKANRVNIKNELIAQYEWIQDHPDKPVPHTLE